jgi:hypothetical protein
MEIIMYFCFRFPMSLVLSLSLSLTFSLSFIIELYYATCTAIYVYEGKKKIIPTRHYERKWQNIKRFIRVYRKIRKLFDFFYVSGG